MSKNMLTIDRLSDFTVVGLLDTCRLSDVCVVRALSRAICDRLSDIGVLEGSNQGRVPKSGVSKHFRYLKEVRLFPKI